MYVTGRSQEIYVPYSAKLSNFRLRQLVRCSYSCSPCGLPAFPEATWASTSLEVSFPLTMMALSGTLPALHLACSKSPFLLAPKMGMHVHFLTEHHISLPSNLMDAYHTTPPFYTLGNKAQTVLESLALGLPGR